jgi:hypothetical protein
MIEFSPTPPAISRTEGPVLVALIMVGVGLPTLVAAKSGSFVIPHEDDWAYRRVALALYHTGHYQLVGWGPMTLVGQMVFVQPFLWVARGRAWALGTSTAVLAVVVIASSYLLARTVVARRDAVWAVAGLLVFPGFLLNTAWFMTEVPCLAAEATCLALGIVTLGRKGDSRLRWLTASLLVGIFGFSIRQFAVAAPAAVLIAVSMSDRRRWRQYCLAGVGLALACAFIYLWTLSLPGQQISPVHLPSFGEVTNVAQAITTMGLVLLPVLLLVWGGWRFSRINRATLLGGIAGAAVVAVPSAARLLGGTGNRGLLVSGLLTTYNQVLPGLRPAVFPRVVWIALEAAAAIGTVLGGMVVGQLIGNYVRQRTTTRPEQVAEFLGTPRGLLASFCVLYGGGLAAFSFVVSGIADLYLWPLVVPLAVLLLAYRDRRAATDGSPTEPTRSAGPVPAWAALTGLALVALALLLNQSAFDAARWRAGNLAVTEGVSAQSVDAGIEWVGFHTGERVRSGAPLAAAGRSRFDTMFPSFRPCAVVSASPLRLRGAESIASPIVQYRLLLFEGTKEYLYLYRLPGCSGQRD